MFLAVCPLDITQIKPQVIKYDANLPGRGIEVNFMNMHILIDHDNNLV
jgi:hypothetical protein